MASLRRNTFIQAPSLARQTPRLAGWVPVGMTDWLPSPSLHLTIAILAVLIYVLTSRIHRERRAPAAAIGWVIGMLLLPYLLLPLYFLFGRRKLTRHAVPAQPKPSVDAHWAQRLCAAFGAGAAAPGRFQLHADGVQARDALWATFDGARERLDVCTFLLGNDAFGQEVLQRLIALAESGIAVRLLLDGVGQWSSDRQGLQRLRDAGAQVAIFRPLLSWHRVGPRNLRNHRKLTIADGHMLWAGGRNLSTEYFLGSAQAPPWIDLSFSADGGVAAAAEAQFERDWLSAGGLPRMPVVSTSAASVSAASPSAASERLEGSEAAADALMQFVASGPDQVEDTVHALLVEACVHARHRIDAVTPYFVPTDALLDALRLAALRGVNVRLLLPAQSNHHLADFARHRGLRQLAAAGVSIRLAPRMVHAKACVFDDSLAIAGSVNLDLRSLLLNHEDAVLFYGSAEVTAIRDWIGSLAVDTEPYCAQPPGLIRDVAEGLLLTVAFQL